MDHLVIGLDRGEVAQSPRAMHTRYIHLTNADVYGITSSYEYQS